MSTVAAMADNMYMLYKVASDEAASPASGSTASSPAGNTSKTTAAKGSQALTPAESSTIAADTAAERNAAIDEAQAQVSALSDLIGRSSGDRDKGFRAESGAYSSTSDLFSNLFSSSDAATLEMTTINALPTDRSTLASSYSDTKKEFQTQYDSAVTDLTDSAASVSNTLFNFTLDDIRAESDGTKTYSDNLSDAMSNIMGLVDNYNKVLGLTSNYKGISSGMADLQSVFSNTIYHADTYADYGINVDADTGALSVDQDKLAAALSMNSAGAQAALGSEGLAGQAASSAATATQQTDSVFPSLSDMLGDKLKADSIYTNPTVINASNDANVVGSLIDEMF